MTRIYKSTGPPSDIAVQAGHWFSFSSRRHQLEGESKANCSAKRNTRSVAGFGKAFDMVSLSVLQERKEDRLSSISHIGVDTASVISTDVVVNLGSTT